MLDPASPKILEGCESQIEGREVILALPEA